MKTGLAQIACAALAALTIIASACKGEANNLKLDGQPVRNTQHYATIETDRGNIVVDVKLAEH